MRLLTIAACVAVCLGAARADEAEANRLPVEATRLVREAAGLPPGEGRRRPDLLRVSDQAAPLASCDAPCVWEHQYGDGDLRSLWVMTDVLPRFDGTIVVIGGEWAARERRTWLAAFGPAGDRLWEQSGDGVICDGALIDGGIAVLAGDDHNGPSRVQILGPDGQGTAEFPLSFAAHAIADDGNGGFLVMGSSPAPAVSRHDASGRELWTWSEPGGVVPGAESGAVTAATVLPGGDVRVLGFWDGAAPEEGARVIWTGTLGSDGTMRDVQVIDRVAPVRYPVDCDPIVRLWQIDTAGDGTVVRYDWTARPEGYRRTTVVRFDAAGAELWRRVEPADADLRADPAVFDEIGAVSGARDGGMLVAGQRTGPDSDHAGFVSRWSEEGETVWTTEIRRPSAGGRANDAYFTAVAEADDGGVLATMTDGAALLQMRGFIFRLGPDGEAP